MAGSKIAVVGVGAIGGSVAADLADLGRHEVQLCARTPFDVLEVTHPAGTSRANAARVTSPGEATPADWVLLATKAHQSEGVVPWIERLSGPGTVVAVLQNGVDHEERIRPLVPVGLTVLPVVVQLPAEKKAPGRIEQRHSGLLTVPNTDVGRAFARLFDGARTRVDASDQFITQAWWKLLSNAAVGGVCALAQRETPSRTIQRCKR